MDYQRQRAKTILLPEKMLLVISKPNLRYRTEQIFILLVSVFSETLQRLKS